MPEATTPVVGSVDALVAKSQERDAAVAKVTRTTKDRDALTKRIVKEQGIADALQKEYDTMKAAIDKAVAGTPTPKK